MRVHQKHRREGRNPDRSQSAHSLVQLGYVWTGCKEATDGGHTETGQMRERDHVVRLFEPG